VQWSIRTQYLVLADLLTPGTGVAAINSAPVIYSEVAIANTGVTQGHIMQNVQMNAENSAGNGRIIIMWKVGSGGALEYGCDANRNGIMNEVAVYDTLELNNGKTIIRYASIDGQDIPMHFCSPYMLAAYAGFSGLRPMTEFEYEKACRGPLDAKPNEYAWGSSAGVAGDYMMNLGRWTVAAQDGSSIYKNINRGNEKLSVTTSPFGTGGTAVYYSTSWWSGWGYYRQAQLVRVGAFADTNTNRQSSGASYWGIMNLSDNAYEYTVLATTPAAGLTYNGEHGNGVLVLDNNGIYPDGFNPWRLPTNTTNWWSIRGIFLFTQTAVGGQYNYALLPNGMLSDKTKGMVGYRNLGVFASQKYTAMFSGIRCVRTVGAAK
jgi:hypothetical protein